MARAAAALRLFGGARLRVALQLTLRVDLLLVRLELGELALEALLGPAHAAHLDVVDLVAFEPESPEVLVQATLEAGRIARVVGGHPLIEPRDHHCVVARQLDRAVVGARDAREHPLDEQPGKDEDADVGDGEPRAPRHLLGEAKLRVVVELHEHVGERAG